MDTGLLSRLDELDKKRDRYENDVNNLLGQERLVLMKIAATASLRERTDLKFWLKSVLAEVLVLEPLQPDEMAERYALMDIVEEENANGN